MLILIWAQAHERAIGKDGALPWHVPEDMALFKRLTLGHPVIMGRKTWDSLDPRWKPLPGRENFVVSRRFAHTEHTVPAPPKQSMSCDAGIEMPPHSSAHFCPSLEEAYAQAQEMFPHSLVWLIGGGQLFSYALEHHLASGAVVTTLDLSVPAANTFAPEIPGEWHPVAAHPTAGWLESATAGVRYRATAFAAPHANFAPEL
ncbi:MAG: dihydrofolate reductase [Arcanobacterium sp.]|nr:dihydrofolate reductase [Arcanobacterium sp.]MDY5589905.1 dihydrofolate reductase [Arcanobacterium sp.]